MPFAWFVALRYLWDSRGMTLLILSAVSIGVSVVVFLSALINGLQTALIDKTLGSQAHIVVHTAREVPRHFGDSTPERGIARTTFSVATNHSWTDAEGQVRTETEWTRCITWGTLAVTGGVLLLRNPEGRISGVVVPAPSDPAALAGDGWTLRLADGWTLRPGARSGYWVVSQKRADSVVPRRVSQ